MKVSVTQDHIAVGVPKKSSSCPIALALQETTGATKVSVGTYTCSWEETNGDHFRANLPMEAENFVRSFDLGNKMKPFSFEVFPWK